MNHIMIDDNIIVDAYNFEEWLREKHNFDHIDIDHVRNFYDSLLEATEWKESYREVESNAQLYEDHVWLIRNEIMDIVDDMQKRLRGKESQEQLSCIMNLLEEL